jgi:hypothetical protein
MLRCFLFAGLLCFMGFSLAAQQKVSGKIYSAETDSTIPYSSVSNRQTRHSFYAVKDGAYSIAASEGDTLVFSSSGFKSRTVVVEYYMFLTAYDVALQTKIITLDPVKVQNSYRRDSAERREYYADAFKKKPGITGHNGPDDGVGVSVSPLSFFSSKSKSERELKKRLLRDDKEEYINTSFPPELVKQLTGLHDDSLVKFLYIYRPSYKFCRKTSRPQMIIYINDKFKEFKNPDKKGKKGVNKFGD